MPRKSAPPPTPIGEIVMIPKPVPKEKKVKPAPLPPPPPPPPSPPAPTPEPEPLIKEITPSYYEQKVRPKKELSEKQKANLERLIERNKAKAIERRVTVTDAIPEVIPEDKILVRIKPKRVYNRKPKETEVATSLSPIVPQKHVESPKNTVVFPSDSEVSEVSESEPEPEPRRRRKRAVKPTPKPKYYYETETTTADEESDESDEDDYKVAKYHAKAEKRMKVVQKIDQRLQQLHMNPYQSRGISVF